MTYNGLSILRQLEEYIPYMLEDELIFIIFEGAIPSADCIKRWEYRRIAKENRIEQAFKKARKREELAKNLQRAKRR